MTSPISGGSSAPSAFSVTRRLEPQRPQLTPDLHVRTGGEGSARAERSYVREQWGVDRFDPASNARLPPGAQAAARAIPELAAGRGEVGGSVSALRRDGDVAGLHVEGRALVAQGSAQGNYRVSGQGVEASGNVRAGMLLGEATARGADGNVTGTLTAGATASMAGTLNINPSTGQYQAGVNIDNFAGVRAEGSLRVGTDAASVTGRFAAQAGVGLTARLEGGLTGNRLRGRAELGAALGIGGRLGVSVDVNVPQVAITAGRYAAGAAGTAGRAISGAVSGLSHRLGFGH
jgi:hypothetical protein